MGEWTPYMLNKFEYEVLKLYIKYGHGETKLYNASFFTSSLTDETVMMTLNEFIQKVTDYGGTLWSEIGEDWDESDFNN